MNTSHHTHFYSNNNTLRHSVTCLSGKADIWDYHLFFFFFSSSIINTLYSLYSIAAERAIVGHL